MRRDLTVNNLELKETNCWNQKYKDIKIAVSCRLHTVVEVNHLSLVV
jgi:hypothetical protein